MIVLTYGHISRTSEMRTPLYSGHFSCSEGCPHSRGSTVYPLGSCPIDMTCSEIRLIYIHISHTGVCHAPATLCWTVVI